MEWREVVNGLIDQTEQWALLGGFAVSVSPNEESPEVNALTVQNGGNVIHVEPALYAAERVPTAVDVYAYPSLIRVRLKGPDETGAWEIYTSDNIPLRRAWNENTFLELCADLVAAA